MSAGQEQAGDAEPDLRVLIAGGGIGGLALALTLHDLGVPFQVFEAVREVRPLGVGINLQPNAVRELNALGFGDADLAGIGVSVREWALIGRNGQEIHAEPRGIDAGYNWPQYAVHRGALHMALYERLVARAGPGAVRLGTRVTGYVHGPDGAVSALIRDAEGRETREAGRLLIAADGIHSMVRAQMHPGQPPIHWGGALMWRGTTQAKPLRGGASFVGLGTSRQRLVIYPLSPADPGTGLATINWIAEVTVDDPGARDAGLGWFRQVALDEVMPHFRDWRFDWLDVPALLSGAQAIWENPMIDRDPVPTWVDGPVALLGDAAHAMYPTGSNGASQAVIDGRVLGRCLLDHGLTPAALKAYDARLCAPISALVLRNREAGPFGLLNLVDARSTGDFDDIDTVVPRAEREAFMAAYKGAAGFDRDRLNGAPPLIPPGARINAQGS